MSSLQTTTDLEAAANAIRDHERFLLTTHENPDGDALGSLLAAKLALDRLGKDAVMYLAGQVPLPAEYGFMKLDELRREVPTDVATRVLLALDCANASRLGGDYATLLESAPLVVDIDHHHDNTRGGVVDRRDLARSAASARRGADARDRGVALHRARHRHGPVPIHQHDAPGAAARSRAGRGRREPPPSLSGCIRER